MANENKEVGDIVKKCKILLLDIGGTTTSLSFVKDKLVPYAEENVKQFLETQWDSDDVKEVVSALRKLALEDQEKSVEGHVAIPGEDASKEDQIDGLVKNVKWQMSADREVGPLKQLQGMIWKQGYDKGDIKGHVYDDVSAALEQWQSVDGQKVYIYSSGSVQSQKLLFGQSLAGDLLKYIEGYFDTEVGDKEESTSYSNIIEKIGCKAEDVLFLTDIVKEAEAAKTAGLRAVLVSREGNAPIPCEATESYVVIHSLGQLSSNKRKTDPQEEQPAKIAKTGVSNDVKTTAETEITKQETPVEEKQSEPEKMEVEETPTPVTETTDSKLNDDKKKDEVISEVIVEELTDAKENDIPIVDATPIITENDETKADKQETEKMETEITEKVEENKSVETQSAEPEKPQTEPEKPVEKNAVSDQKTETKVTPDVPKENVVVNEVKEQASIEEMVVTEIEEVTDKDAEMAEIIEDLEPVVEEPNEKEDMELQNVGEVLEKECDEILSKVQDVTNLDNIPLKSTLNPISEETMENLDSNDIMERILDKEIELQQSNEKGKEAAPETAENTDSNDIIERILDKEIELLQSDEMEKKAAPETVENTDKPVQDIKVDENTEKPLEVKPDIVEETNSVETKVDNETIENSATKENSASEIKETESKIEKVVPPEDITEVSSPKVEETPKPETVNNEESKMEENVESTSEQKPEESTPAETKENDTVTEEQKPKENATEESQVNGDATNGEKETVNQNGDSSKDELSSRLSVENGKEVNGSNGDSMDAENGTDKKVDAEVADIKVKTVTSDEPHSERIEQPTEA